MCVSGDAASMEFINTHFFIATCEGTNVLHFVRVVTVILSLAKNKINILMVNCDKLSFSVTDIQTRQSCITIKTRYILRNKTLFLGQVSSEHHMLRCVNYR